MKKILVTGAAGFIGKYVCDQLRKDGHTVIAVARGNKKDIGHDLEVIENIDSLTDWSNLLKDLDSIVHLAGRAHLVKESRFKALDKYREVNINGTINLARQAAKAGVRRFVFISTVAVYGESSIKPLNSSDATNPNSAYALTKLEAEKELRKISDETGLEVVIIRPPLVYGVGAPGNFGRIVKLVKLGIPLPFGLINNKRSFLYVENLVSLIIRCLDETAAVNRIFLASDDQDVSSKQMVKMIASAVDKRIFLIPIPVFLLRFIFFLIGRKSFSAKLLDSFQVDISETKKILNWSPEIGFEKGIKLALKNVDFNK